MNPRYIPDTRTNMMITNLGLSRIEPTRETLTMMSANNAPTTDSPFNPEIYNEVRYSAKPIITSRNRVLSKYENNNPGNNNIALYDTHVFDMNMTNVPAFAHNELQKSLQERAKNKIKFKNEDLLYARGSKNASNGWDYNPYLPESPTNQRPTNLTPVTLDERLIYHTSERPWNYESDRANIAYKLQRSEMIKERNQRQHEADDELFHRTKKDRWVEPKQVYRELHTPLDFYLTEENKRAASKQNDRKSIDVTEAFATSRVGFDANDINHLHNDIYGNFMPDYDRHMKDVYEEDLIKARIEQFNTDVTPKGMITTAADFITKTITNFFGWNQNGAREYLTSDDNLEYDEDGSLKYHYSHDQDFSADNARVEQFSGIQERYYYKPDHMLVVKDGNLVETYPDEDFSYTAVSVITQSPVGLVRSIALVDDGKVIFAQKRANDSIFDGDHLPIGDDLIIAELPIENLDRKLRERIRKYNTGTKRDKVIELTYDDFIQFSEWVVKHPEVQKRLKKEKLHQRVRANDYDADIVNNFEGKKTFVDEKVYAGLADAMRQRQILHQKGRVDKDLVTVEGYSSLTPFTTSSEPFRNVQHGLNLTSRRGGVKRGAFD